MEKDKEITEVIFRKENNGDIIAAFPYVSYASNYGVLYYCHIGQHGECKWSYFTGCTKPAKPEDYEDLKKELEGLGYNLRVIKKPCHRKMCTL